MWNTLYIFIWRSLDRGEILFAFLPEDGEGFYLGVTFVLESRFIKCEALDNVYSKCPNNDGELLASNMRTTNFVYDYLCTAFGNHSFRGFGPISATLSSLIIFSRSPLLGSQSRVFCTTCPFRAHCSIHNYEQTKLWSENLKRRDHLRVLHLDWKMVLTLYGQSLLGCEFNWIVSEYILLVSFCEHDNFQVLCETEKFLSRSTTASSWRIAHVLRGVSYTITETISVK